MKIILNKKYQYGGTIGGGTYTIPVSTKVEPKKAVDVAAAPISTYIAPPPSANRSQFQIDESLLKAKGLSGETSYYLNQLRNAQQTINSLSDLDIITQTDQFKQALNVFNKLSSESFINELRRNEEEFKVAQTRVKERKAETATVTYNGNIRVKDIESDKEIYVTPEEYAKNIEKYQRVTAARALQTRNEKELFNNELTYAVQSTYGIEDIANYLNDQFLKNLGQKGYKEKIDSIESLQELGGMKAIVTNGGGWTKNIDLVKDAISTAQQFLNADQWAQIKAKAVEDAAAQGLKFTNEEQLNRAASLIISQFFSRAVVDKDEKIYNLGVSASSLGGGSGGGGTEQMKEWEYQYYGIGPSEKIEFTDGTRISMTGHKTPTIFNPNFKINLPELDATITKQGLLKDSKLPEAIQVSKIQTAGGDIPLRYEDIRDNVIVKDGSSYYSYAYSLPDGSFTVDPKNSQIKQFRQAQQQIINKTDLSVSEKKEALDNAMKQLNIQRVVVFQGFVNTDANERVKGVFKRLKENNYSVDVDSEEENILREIYKVTTSKEPGSLWWKDDYQKTTFVAPVTDAGLTRLALDETKIELPEQEALFNVVQQRGLNNPSSQVVLDPSIVRTSLSNY